MSEILLYNTHLLNKGPKIRGPCTINFLFSIGAPGAMHANRITTALFGYIVSSFFTPVSLIHCYSTPSSQYKLVDYDKRVDHYKRY